MLAIVDSFLASTSRLWGEMYGALARTVGSVTSVRPRTAVMNGRLLGTMYCGTCVGDGLRDCGESYGLARSFGSFSRDGRISRDLTRFSPCSRLPRPLATDLRWSSIATPPTVGGPPTTALNGEL